MPNVAAPSRIMGNGLVQTTFTDSVEASSRTYTYPSQQNGLVVTNNGKSNITVTVNATPYTVTPNQTQTITADFTSFSIVAASGIQHFLATSNAFDTQKVVVSSAWNMNPFQLGTYRLWVDSLGKLRIKNGAPTSDTDGVTVGSQT